MDALTIRYTFALADGRTETFHLNLDPDSLELQGNIPEELPVWARLEFRQCPNCPLNAAEHPHCPVAANCVNIVSRFERIVSYDRVQVTVETEDRTVSRETSAQRGLSSLMGLVMATSGCPHTEFFKPMARFHLPLANEEETTMRSVSTYLLAQYFLHRDGVAADLALEGLREIYERVSIVNAAITDRLRAAGQNDSTLNAVVLLDLYTIIVPAAVEDSLQEIRTILAPFIESVMKVQQETGQYRRLAAVEDD